MERKRGTTVAIVIALIVAIVSLGVAFAAFSTTLNINGTATVQATTWDIYFTGDGTDYTKPSSTGNLPAANIAPSGTATNDTATINATTFTWAANFKSPGDKIVYTIYVKNAGDYNAQVSNVVLPAISCTNDTKSACTHLHYGLYKNASGASGTEVTTSDTIPAKGSATYYLVAYLDSSYGGNDGSGLVSTSITTSTISATITFQQTGNAQPAQ